MTLEQSLDLASALLVLVGALLSFAAGLGLMRFSDLLMRMHAQTKPQVFGLLCILLGFALQQTSVSTILFLLPIVFFQMITTPVAAATLARGGYRNEHFPREDLFVDDLASAVDAAEREHAEEERVADERADEERQTASGDASGTSEAR
ncbi:MAG: monovalent cation/H(+) antiporter subunit G [Pseudoclavibacter sp.]